MQFNRQKFIHIYAIYTDITKSSQKRLNSLQIDGLSQNLCPILLFINYSKSKSSWKRITLLNCLALLLLKPYFKQFTRGRQLGNENLVEGEQDGSISKSIGYVFFRMDQWDLVIEILGFDHLRSNDRKLRFQGP